MRKGVPLIVIFIFLSGLLKAQTFIPKIGISLNNIADKNFNEYYTYHNKFGFVGGLAFNFPLSEKIALQPELLYNQKGLKINDYSGSQMRQSITLNYLQLPILIQYSRRTLFILAGPAIGYGLNGWAKSKYGSFMYTNRVMFHKPHDDQSSLPFAEIIQIHHRWDIGFIIGFGMKIKNFLTIDCRYDLSLTRLNNSKFDIGKGGNRSFLIMIGVPIRQLTLGESI